MKRGQLFLTFAAMLLVAGCDSRRLLAPPDGLSNAAATPSCGPADGAAVAIYLAATPIASLEPATPYIRVNVWKSTTALVGTWSLSPSSVDGFASRVDSPSGSAESAASGRITVMAVDKDGTITGSLDLLFPITGQVRGGFTAHWIPRTMLCG